MNRYSRMSTRTLNTWLRNYRRKLANKRAVMGRHQPGTAYHTRAEREAETYQQYIADVEAELKRR